jgi:2-polyprenyl-6-methoxyphenol hydroxylase-like FAD-dependent oxidoreductase
VRKWALIERNPMPNRSADSVLLVGDACHPMLPYMAQAASSSMEDGVVLARCFEALASDDVDAVFCLCETNRKERASAFQRGSKSNDWMKKSAGIDCVYEYDAWTAPLRPAPLYHAENSSLRS